MKKKITIFLMICVATTVVAGADKNPDGFDLFRDGSKIVSYDIMVLDGYQDFDPLDRLITTDTFVSGKFFLKVKSVTKSTNQWDDSLLKKLFEGYKKKNYKPCACMPSYKLALQFYARNGIGDHLDKVATILLDDGHDSIVVSDQAHGRREYRFSIGHSLSNRVLKLIAHLARKEGFAYQNGKISNMRPHGTGDARGARAPVREP